MKESDITKKIYKNIEPIKQGLLKFDELIEIRDDIFNFLKIETSKSDIWKLRFRKFHDEIYRVTISVDDNDYVQKYNPKYRSSWGVMGVSGWLGIEPVIDFYFYYIKQKKVVKRLKDEELWVESRTEGSESHLFIGSRQEKNKVHLIFSSTGEMRIDKKDSSPSDILNKVESILTTKSGKTIKSIFEFDDIEGQS